MKNMILLPLCILLAGRVYGQVGVNTQNPQGVFHVDGAKDNALTGTPTVAQQANDVIITSSGSIGVGTTSPSTKLHINTVSNEKALRITDGTQGAGKVLTSDSNGIGSWQDAGVAGGITTITGVTPQTLTPYGTTDDKYMNSYIDLPTGKWFIFLGYLLHGATGANQRYASRFTFSSSSSSIETVGYNYIGGNKYVFNQTSNGGAGAHDYGMFTSGIIRVEVTSTSAVRLHVWDNGSRGSGETTGVSIGPNGEDYLFAIKAN
ncbi:hypothetical protein [Chryseobacterium potabilaquae]|uniref:C1q domain-containing protein n=1 Tax=Chryseobacterium potabilaquae TaxID=2675057 RepID=A0A6N4XDI7_9FLAO|nr:hypothetical protein [Chryseobacterium potabilaquae]CAA7196680.1 hypothetical protein CHRY9293_02756 [Chryseobacterium potabilaquae]